MNETKNTTDTNWTTPLLIKTDSREVFESKLNDALDHFWRAGIPVVVEANIDGICPKMIFTSDGVCRGCYPLFPDEGKEFFAVVYSCENDDEAIQWADRKGFYRVGEFCP